MRGLCGCTGRPRQNQHGHSVLPSFHTRKGSSGLSRQSRSCPFDGALPRVQHVVGGGLGLSRCRCRAFGEQGGHKQNMLGATVSPEPSLAARLWSARTIHPDSVLVAVWSCGERKYPCHRFVLAASSQYFKALLSDAWSSSQKAVQQDPDTGLPCYRLLLPEDVTQPGKALRACAGPVSKRAVGLVEPCGAGNATAPGCSMSFYSFGAAAAHHTLLIRAAPLQALSSCWTASTRRRTWSSTGTTPSTCWRRHTTLAARQASRAHVWPIFHR